MALSNEDYRYKELADFLKTRRQKILPSQVGLPSTAHRRTPGLRREEVAQLSGIGLSWYTWLEQGRPIHVSVSILESLSRILLLDNNERRYLYLLASQPFPSDFPEYQSAVSPALIHVLDSLVLCPSFVTDQRWNVIAWNKAADLLYGNFAEMSARERNIVWAMFTNEKYKKLCPDWNINAKRLLGNFRASCGQYIEDPWLISFVEDLKKESAEFEALWSLHEIDNSHETHKKLNHPIVGILEFEVNNFDVTDGTELKLIVHVPLPKTDTVDKMKLLLPDNKFFIT